ncbi:MAG: UDP-N-acetylmuramoylalanyl-D-glutamyl-2,6-diaminopimelate--D-alanyl-D-alanine ligase [Bdellovibrionales bacterium]
MTTELIWQAQDVINAVCGKCSDTAWQAHGISIDSRTAQPGDLFVALIGPAHDGHDHAAAALTGGAAAAIVSRPPPNAAEGAKLVFVEDTFKALEDLGRAGRERAKGNIIAITGSVGKTGGKEMLRVALSACGETYANEGSFNNHWGVPLSLARMPADAKFGVFELGMNHAGELGPLAKQVRPHVALVTNVEAVHLEFFASVKDIADAKAEIFLGMDSSGMAVLNRDNPHFARLDDAACNRGLRRILSFGRDKLAEARLIEYHAMTGGSEIVADILGRPTRYRLGAAGEHLALNSLGVLLAAVLAGGDLDLCAAALAQYKPPRGRGVANTIRTGTGEITLIDESYNASPVAVKAAIQVLSGMTPASGGKRILVLGDMRELGNTSPALHAALAKDIAQSKIERVYCCGEWMEHLYRELPPALRGLHAKDSGMLAPQVAADLRAGDIVTVKGSKAVRMDIVIEAIKALGSSGTQKMAS